MFHLKLGTHSINQMSEPSVTCSRKRINSAKGLVYAVIIQQLKFSTCSPTFLHEISLHALNEIRIINSNCKSLRIKLTRKVVTMLSNFICLTNNVTSNINI